MHRLLRTILIYVTFLGCGLIAWVNPDQMDGSSSACASCCMEWEAGENDSTPEDPSVCGECQDSSAPWVTDLTSSDDLLKLSAIVLLSEEPERLLLPEDPLLEGVDPPLI